MTKNINDHPLVSSPCIFKAKQHYHVTIYAIVGDEGGSLGVGWVYWYLIVVRICIHEQNYKSMSIVLFEKVKNYLFGKYHLDLYSLCIFVTCFSF